MRSLVVWFIFLFLSHWTASADRSKDRPDGNALFSELQETSLDRLLEGTVAWQRRLKTLSSRHGGLSMARTRQTNATGNSNTTANGVLKEGGGVKVDLVLLIAAPMFVLVLAVLAGLQHARCSKKMPEKENMEANVLEQSDLISGEWGAAADEIRTIRALDQNNRAFFKDESSHKIQTMSLRQTNQLRKTSGPRLVPWESSSGVISTCSPSSRSSSDIRQDVLKRAYSLWGTRVRPRSVPKPASLSSGSRPSVLERAYTLLEARVRARSVLSRRAATFSDESSLSMWGGSFCRPQLKPGHKLETMVLAGAVTRNFKRAEMPEADAEVQVHASVAMFSGSKSGSALYNPLSLGSQEMESRLHNGEYDTVLSKPAIEQRHSSFAFRLMSSGSCKAMRKQGLAVHQVEDEGGGVFGLEREMHSRGRGVVEWGGGESVRGRRRQERQRRASARERKEETTRKTIQGRKPSHSMPSPGAVTACEGDEICIVSQPKARPDRHVVDQIPYDGGFSEPAPVVSSSASFSLRSSIVAQLASNEDEERAWKPSPSARREGLGIGCGKQRQHEQNDTKQPLLSYLSQPCMAPLVAVDADSKRQMSINAENKRHQVLINLKHPTLEVITSPSWFRAQEALQLSDLADTNSPDWVQHSNDSNFPDVGEIPSPDPLNRAQSLVTHADCPATISAGRGDCDRSRWPGEGFERTTGRVAMLNRLLSSDNRRGSLKGRSESISSWLQSSDTRRGLFRRSQSLSSSPQSKQSKRGSFLFRRGEGVSRSSVRGWASKSDVEVELTETMLSR